MRSGQRPCVEIARRDQRERLIVLVEMDAGGIVADVVLHDHGPVAHRYILQLLERVDGGRNFPDRREIAGRLLLQGGRDFHDVADGHLVGFGNERNLLDECSHQTLPSIGLAVNILSVEP